MRPDIEAIKKRSCCEICAGEDIKALLAYIEELEDDVDMWRINDGAKPIYHPEDWRANDWRGE